MLICWTPGSWPARHAATWFWARPCLLKFEASIGNIIRGLFVARSMPASEQTLTLRLYICNHLIVLYFLFETGIRQVHGGSLAGMPRKGYHCLNPVVKRNPNHLDALGGRQFFALGHIS
jgi:hypothetical protein